MTTTKWKTILQECHTTAILFDTETLALFAVQFFVVDRFTTPRFHSAVLVVSEEFDDGSSVMEGRAHRATNWIFFMLMFFAMCDDGTTRLEMIE